MKKGIDCTAQITKNIAETLRAKGITFVCRYLVPADMAWKRLTKSEAGRISEAGISILSVYESTADRACGGNAAGLADGAAALKEAKGIGQTEGSAIYFAVDFDAQSSDYDKIEAYLKSAASQIMGYHIGVYGSYRVCEEMAKRGIKYCWQTYAWSRGKKSVHANVYQYKNGISLAGITCDLNESYGNEGFWKPEPTYEDALRIISGKAGIDQEYWISRRHIDPNFELFVKKLARVI